MTKLSAYALAILMLTALIFPCAPALSGSEPAQTREEAVSSLLEACDRLSAMKEACLGKVTKGEPGEPFNSARLIVKTEGEPDTLGALGFAEGTNGRWVIQYASPDEAEAAAERFACDPLVKYAVPDTEYRVYFSASGAAAGRPGGYNSWGYGEEHVGMAALAERLLAKYGSESAMPEVIVAVCDSGVNVNHEFLSGRTVPGYDFVNNDADPSDGFGHGTFCAGVVADGTLSNVRIMPLKCISDEGYFSTGDVVNAIEYAYLNGCAAANLSLIEYNPYVEELYEEAVNAAADAGMVCCVASGNWSGNASDFVPGKIERSFTVAAHYPDHTMWPLSNVGAAVDITAPGVDIMSTLNTGGFDVQSGTSFAAPHAAACCAMIKAYDPGLGPDAIVALLKANAVDEGYSGGGAGRLCVGSLFSEDPLPVLLGDVNGDGVVDSADALLTLRYAMGIVGEASLIVEAADIDGDGAVTSADALMILRRALGADVK
ncbi:MAG: S8 family serine peptidase [Clostridia bacterium]|nr:S8 family serine peptidase [Clostridia bacterium]